MNGIVAIYTCLKQNHYLKTKSRALKLLFILTMLVLVVGLMMFLITNVTGYLSHDVVTNIKTVDVTSQTFPAITICLVGLGQGIYTTLELKDILIGCSILNKNCLLSDFRMIKVRFLGLNNMRVNCYTFNGGYDINGMQKELIKTDQVGFFTDFQLHLHISPLTLVLYCVGDNNVTPVALDMMNIMTAGSFSYLGLDKNVNERLGHPYNECIKSARESNSPLMNEFIQNNVKYRQINCLEFCSNQKYQNCHEMCPVECDYTTYPYTENKINNNQEFYQQFNLSNSQNYRLENIAGVSIFYKTMKQTLVNQVPKTTFTDLVSNAGGIKGLFLEVSFVSYYRAIRSLIEIIFFY